MVERAYRRQRAKRHARVERTRERKHANLRFWLVLVILVSLSVYLALTVWQNLQEMFGLDSVPDPPRNPLLPWNTNALH